ncbi:MAG: GNAT family N-acetyltransferase, partial [Saprospiraceae bacterium]
MNYFDQQSERLNFKPLTEDHIPLWIDFFENNNSLAYLGMDLTKPFDFLAEDWIRAQFERYKKFGLGHLAISLRESKEFIGLAGIIPRTVDEESEYEIAYSLIPKYWGNGYATEAARQLHHFGSNNIITNRFISMIHIDNHPSKKVALKNGMQLLKHSTWQGIPV